MEEEIKEIVESGSKGLGLSSIPITSPDISDEVKGFFILIDTNVIKDIDSILRFVEDQVELNRVVFTVDVRDRLVRILSDAIDHTPPLCLHCQVKCLLFITRAVSGYFNTAYMCKICDHIQCMLFVP